MPKKRCHRHAPERQLTLVFAEGDALPKIPDPTPSVEEMVKRASPAWDWSQEERHENALATWRPKVKVISWTTLKRAVAERSKFAIEWTNWFGGHDGPIPGSKELWRIDGASAVATELRDAADLVVREVALEARKAGETWSDIAAHLNITKSAAIARYGRPEEDA